MSFTTSTTGVIQTAYTSYAYYEIGNDNNYRKALSWPAEMKFNSVMAATIRINTESSKNKEPRLYLPNAVGSSVGYNSLIWNIGTADLKIYEYNENYENDETDQPIGEILAGSAALVLLYNNDPDLLPFQAHWSISMLLAGQTSLLAQQLAGPGLTVFPIPLDTDKLAITVPVKVMKESDITIALTKDDRASLFFYEKTIPLRSYSIVMDQTANYDQGFFFSVKNETESTIEIEFNNSGEEGELDEIVTPGNYITFIKIKKDSEGELNPRKNWFVFKHESSYFQPNILSLSSDDFKKVGDVYTKELSLEEAYGATIWQVEGGFDAPVDIKIPLSFGETGGLWAIVNKIEAFQESTPAPSLTLTLLSSPNSSVELPNDLASEVISTNAELFLISGGEGPSPLISLEKGSLIVGGEEPSQPVELKAPVDFSFLISDGEKNTRWSHEDSQLTPGAMFYVGENKQIKQLTGEKGKFLSYTNNSIPMPIDLPNFSTQVATQDLDMGGHHLMNMGLPKDGILVGGEGGVAQAINPDPTTPGFVVYDGTTTNFAQYSTFTPIIENETYSTIELNYPDINPFTSGIVGYNLLTPSVLLGTSKKPFRLKWSNMSTSLGTLSTSQMNEGEYYGFMIRALLINSIFVNSSTNIISDTSELQSLGNIIVGSSRIDQDHLTTNLTLNPSAITGDIIFTPEFDLSGGGFYQIILLLNLAVNGAVTPPVYPVSYTRPAGPLVTIDLLSEADTATSPIFIPNGLFYSDANLKVNSIEAGTAGQVVMYDANRIPKAADLDVNIGSIDLMENSVIVGNAQNKGSISQPLQGNSFLLYQNGKTDWINSGLVSLAPIERQISTNDFYAWASPPANYPDRATKNISSSPDIPFFILEENQFSIKGNIEVESNIFTLQYNNAVHNIHNLKLSLRLGISNSNLQDDFIEEEEILSFQDLYSYQYSTIVNGEEISFPNESFTKQFSFNLYDIYEDLNFSGKHFIFLYPVWEMDNPTSEGNFIFYVPQVPGSQTFNKLLYNVNNIFTLQSFFSKGNLLTFDVENNLTSIQAGTAGQVVMYDAEGMPKASDIPNWSGNSAIQDVDIGTHALKASDIETVPPLVENETHIYRQNGEFIIGDHIGQFKFNTTTGSWSFQFNPANDNSLNENNAKKEYNYTETLKELSEKVASLEQEIKTLKGE